MPSSGKGDKCVYLVYGKGYELLGVAPTSEGGHRLGTSYSQPFKVVGPVTQGVPIDWDKVGEESYGVDHGPTKDYVDLNDGIPYEPSLREPLTKEQARALPSHAAGH